MTGLYWIASYPKSGNTWMRMLLASLRAGGARMDFAASRAFAPLPGHAAEVESHLDVAASDLTQRELAELQPDLVALMARDAGAPLFRKTHECWGRTPAGRLLFPPAATLGSLYLVRDPRDVAASWAHHRARGIDETIDFMARPRALRADPGAGVVMDQHISSWSGHVASWRGADPVPLVIRYEDLLAEPERWLGRAAAHLGIAASAAARAAAVAATRFAVLQAAEEAQGFEMGQAAGRRFFRRGEAGGWRDTLTAAQSDRIAEDHGEIMRALGYL